MMGAMPSFSITSHSFGQWGRGYFSVNNKAAAGTTIRGKKFTEGYPFPIPVAEDFLSPLKRKGDERQITSTGCCKHFTSKMQCLRAARI
jgi:hypothetical protein